MSNKTTMGIPTEPTEPKYIRIHNAIEALAELRDQIEVIITRLMEDEKTRAEAASKQKDLAKKSPPTFSDVLNTSASRIFTLRDEIAEMIYKLEEFLLS